MLLGLNEKQLCVSSTLSGTLTCCAAQSVRKKITMYVCGVTPYDDAHIGHGRCYVTFDVVYRLLLAAGHEVIYCRNVTDIDDKLLKRAAQELGSAMRYQEISQKYTTRFREDVTALGCLVPTHEPLVTDNITEIISCIEALLSKGYAYNREGSIYFRIAAYPSYGQLSKQRIAEMRAGARVEVNDEKNDPLDFALWKSEAEGTFWQSPWGWGRPGWHIECSAMALRYLGETIDIHGGGMDLMFPHHENERAQSECCTGLPFVRIWMHNAFVRVKEEKMSKSLGNFITLRQAFEQIHPMVLRYYYLIHHYRNPLDFSWEDAKAAEKAYRRLIQILGEYDKSLSSTPLTEASQALYERVVTLLYQDLNIQGALSIIFEHAHLIRTDRTLASVLATVCVDMLGLSLTTLPEVTVEITPEIQKLLEERIAARACRDWARADALREELLARNIRVQDDKL